MCMHDKKSADAVQCNQTSYAIAKDEWFTRYMYSPDPANLGVQIILERDAAREEVKSLQNQVSHTTERAVKVNKDNEEVRNENGRLYKERDDLFRENARLREDLRVAKEILKDVRESYQELDGVVRDLRKELESAKQELERRQNVLKRLNQSCDNSTEDHLLLDAAYRKAMDERSTARQELSSARKELVQAKTLYISEVSKLQEELGKVTIELSALKGMDSNLADVKDRLQDQLDAILEAAYRWDDKPHHLFTAIYHAAHNHGGAEEIREYMDEAMHLPENYRKALDKITELNQDLDKSRKSIRGLMDSNKQQQIKLNEAKKQGQEWYRMAMAREDETLAAMVKCPKCNALTPPGGCAWCIMRSRISPTDTAEPVNMQEGNEGKVPGPNECPMCIVELKAGGVCPSCAGIYFTVVQCKTCHSTLTVDNTCHNGCAQPKKD